MGIVIPLGVEIAAQVACDIATVLEHEMNKASSLDGGADLRCHLVEPIRFADRVDRVEAQSVEAVFHDPVERILCEEASDLRLAEVDRRAPGRLEVVAEHGRRVARQIVSVGAEVIVDDVEEDHQIKIVRGVDQRLQLVGRAVGCVRRERQHAVVAPVAPTGKIIDRHQLDGGDAEGGQTRQVARNAAEPAEHPAMQLVEHRLRPWSAAPMAVSPLVGGGIDHDTAIMHVAGLRPGRRIWHAPPTREHIAVARTGAARRFHLEPAVALPLHRNRLCAFDGDGDRRLRRRKQAKARAISIDQRRTERQCA